MRVVIADDSILVREGVASLLSAEGFEVAAQAADARELLAAIPESRANVALVDIRMPPSFSDEGLRAAETIGERFPRLGVLVLSHYLDSAYAAALLERRTQGRGYLLKDQVTDPDLLISAVRTVAEGGSFLDPTVVEQLMGRARLPEPLDDLSPRERHILGLMAEGRSNAAICQQLYLSPKTVEGHVRSIFMKLNLPPAQDDHRRVLAVLRYLRSVPGAG